MFFKSLCSLAIVLSVLFSGASCQAQGFYGPQLVGQKAPAATVQKLDGSSADLLSVINGKPSVVAFWATWCPHCREQLAVIHQKKETLKAQGIVVVLVNVGEGARVVQKFLDGKGYDADVFLDGDSQAADVYQVVGIPTIVLVGKDGIVRDVQYGFPDNYAEILN